MNYKDIIEAHKTACIQLVNAFAKKHSLCEYDNRDTYFIDNCCYNVQFGDFTFDMQTIMDDLENDFDEEKLMQWYDYTIDFYDIFGTHAGCPNYKSFVLQIHPFTNYTNLYKLKKIKTDFDKILQEEYEKITTKKTVN